MAPPDEAEHVRSRGFGSVAEQYDRARPSYPPALIADLLRAEPGEIVDVGCGTGKAARLLVGGGRRVVGVEPDARMAAVARSHGIDVEIGAFEDWEDAGRRFDLLVSATAWHWVEPVAGTAKAAEVLRSGGRFAAFWNELHHGAAVRTVFDRVYGRHAPHLLNNSFILGAHDAIDADHDPAAEALVAGPFTGVTAGRRQSYEWWAEYTPLQWVDLVATTSDHLLLAAAVREPLLADLRVDLSALGPRFTVSFRTDLLGAVRR